MTKKLFINGRFLADEKTAVNQVARSLTDHLVQASGGWDVQVVVPPTLAEAANAIGWPVAVHGRRSGVLWEQVELPRLAQKGVIAGFFNTVPMRGSGYVTMLHDTHVFDHPKSYPGAVGHWRRLLSRRAGLAANRILTISEWSKRQLTSHKIGRDDHIGVVHNGAGPAVGMEPDWPILDRVQLREGQSYVLAQSSTMAHKNLSVLLRAFMESQTADLTLVLFGAANKAALKAAGYDVPENVAFVGFVSDAELAALYRGALALCVPSRAEGFGLPALEAMQLGCPVIIAPCAALPEVVENAGLMACADQPSEWAAALDQLHKDPALRGNLVEAGLARARHCTWTNAAKMALRHLDRWYLS